MRKLRYLLIQFDTEIKSYEIPAFRSAIIEKAGREHLSFHNHINDQEVMYGYPVIQYKVIRRQPSIVCLDHGVDEIHHFFQNKKWDITLSGRTIQLNVNQLKMHQFNLLIGENSFDYSINNWLALNQENNKKYHAISDENEKKEFLTRVLIGNIISFAKGVKWDIDKNISLQIQSIEKEGMLKFKKNQLLGISLKFQSNVFLPNYIGLGKGVSHGFGIIKQVNHNKNK